MALVEPAAGGGCVAFALCGTCPSPPPGALLIGNAAYTSGMPALTYPLQDIQVLEQSLKKLNFEVQVVRNADQKAMGRAIRDFGSSAREAQVALVYYSGHGMQARDENYLIPIGATIESEGDLDIEAIQLRALMRQIEDARPKTTVVVLDACRDNPVASRTKSGSKGLSRVQNQPGNTLVVFAAQAGATATDNGVFAKELASRIAEPNVGIRSVFDKVGQAVRQATGQRQSIQRDDQLSEDVVLVATARLELVPEQRPVPPGPVALTAEQIEQQAWEAAIRSNAEAGYRAYLSEYPQGRFAAAARVAVAGLSAANPVLVPPVVPAPAPQTLQAGQVFKDCDVCPQMVVIPGGTFTMGSSSSEQALAKAAGMVDTMASAEMPQHDVNVRSFAASRYAVTRGEFQSFVHAKSYRTEAERNGGCLVSNGFLREAQADKNWRNVGFVQGDDHPVVCVSWFDAQEYVKWVSQQSGKSYRLLSEAEREYAARGGSQTAFWWGDRITTIYANYNSSESYNGSPKGEYSRATVAVSRFAPNPFGLYNVHGNVWEWVEDCFHYGRMRAPVDGSAWTTNCDQDARMFRGGSWEDAPVLLRSAFRFMLGKLENSYNVVGFRLARTLP
jgi:formylglycine-generating enzyme required for sulfatase activity